MDWPHLSSLIRAEASREIGNKASTHMRYYSSGLKLSAQSFNTHIRQHWRIENQLHWQLDAAFGEDQRRVRLGRAADMFFTTRKLALQVLNWIDDKESIKNRRKRAR